MRFSSSILLAALASLVSAQNPFTFTTTPVVTAGTPFNITWAPSTGTVDTVTLVLRQGNPQQLTTVLTIASSIQNTGSYLWTPPTSIVEGTGYAFEIIDNGNSAIVNYSGQFTISSTNTVSSSLPASTTSSGSASVSPSTSASQQTGTKTSSSASNKTTATGSGSSTGVASTSGTSTGSASTTSSAAATATKNAANGLRVGGAVVAVMGAVVAAL